MAADLHLTLNGVPTPVYLGESATLASFYASQAEDAADDAAASEAAAEALVGPVYASTVAGLAAVAEGGFFAVDNGDGSVTIYQDVAGVAVEQRTLATTAYLESEEGSTAVGHLPASTGAELMDVRDAIRAAGVMLTHFGPCGNGVQAEDDAAFALAVATLITDRRTVDSVSFGGSVYPFASIQVPPGDYIVSGGFGFDIFALGLWAVPDSVTITITGDNYLFDIPNRLDYTYVSGITFIGGKGMLNHSFSGDFNDNVAFKHFIEKCRFVDYTECAITSEATNMPFWTIRDNSFYCLEASGTLCKGIALGGLLDRLLIENNNFERNDIHVQIGPQYSGDMHIVRNSFLSFEANRTVVDILLVPNDQLPGLEFQGFGNNSGQGSTIKDNKFGNEGITDIDAKAPRIRIAALDGGPRATAEADLTWKNGDDGANWIIGWSIINNHISTASIVDPSGPDDGPDAPFMDIYVEKVDKFVFRNNQIDGGRFNWLFEHFAGDARYPTKDNTNWEVHVPVERNNVAPFRYGVTNSPVGIIHDCGGMSRDPFTLLPAGSVDPNAATVLTIDLNTEWDAEAGVTRIAATDRAAGSTATDITFPDGTHGLTNNVALDFSAFGASGAIGWLVVDEKVPAADPVTGLEFRVDVTDGVTLTTQLLQTVPVAQYAGFDIRILSFIIPKDTTFGILYARAPYAAAGQNKMILGHVKVGAGRTPPAL